MDTNLLRQIVIYDKTHTSLIMICTKKVPTCLNAIHWILAYIVAYFRRLAKTESKIRLANQIWDNPHSLKKKKNNILNEKKK